MRVKAWHRCPHGEAQRFDLPLGQRRLLRRLEEHMNYTNTTSAAEDFKDCSTIRAAEKSGTIYLVEYSTSDNAKETAYEKIKRLLLSDIEPSRMNAVY